MKIHALQTGTVRIKTAQRKAYGPSLLRGLNLFLDSEWTEPLPIYAWAIEHPEGIIVVDTGETAQAMQETHFPWWHPYFVFAVQFNVTPSEEIGPQLRRVGIRADDVRTVVLTHFHSDHAGGLHHFPKSTFLVSKGEHRAARGLRGRVNGYLPQHWPKNFKPQMLEFKSTPFGAFEKSCALTTHGDVVAVPTPGHTGAHTSVVVVQDGVHYFLAGDTTYTEQFLREQKVDGVSPSVRTAIKTMRKILQHAKSHRTVYLPSHDPDSIQRLSNRKTL